MTSQCHPQLIKHAKGGANSRSPPARPRTREVATLLAVPGHWTGAQINVLHETVLR
ncbi:MAG: hypothetical protein RugAbin2_00131 [Rugosibacter sp.]|nr:hypothetical protein [Rugosibacter sp.]